MKNWIVVGCIWVAAATSAVLLVYKLNPPRHDTTDASVTSTCGSLSEEVVDEPTADVEATTVLEMPVVTIMGTLRGTAEMQGARVVR